MTDAPRISVLMAARDAGRFFAPALDSVAAQTRPDWELILVDDGSVDGSRDAARSRAAADPRITLIENDRSIGLAASLNRAVEAASAPFFARMDADDLCAPDRFERQLAAFEADGALGIAGSNARRIDAEGRPLGATDLPLVDADIRAQALFENPFVHPGVMMRASALHAAGAAYDESFDTTQDWALWADLLPHTRAANLAEPLIAHRQHGGATSSQKRARQRANSVRAQARYAAALFPTGGWQDADLQAVTDAFVCGRAEADAAFADGAGPGRIEACRAALRLLARLQAEAAPEVARAAERYVADRIWRMGLAPPWRRGAAGLAARLVATAPRTSVGAAARIVSARMR